MIVKHIFIQLLFFGIVFARKHHLVIKDDTRRYITLTSFGFYNGGVLNVRLNDFLVSQRDQNKTFGLTLDKTLAGPMNPYLDSHQDRCILEESTVAQQSGPIALFIMDMRNNKVNVKCSADWHTHIFKDTESIKYSYTHHLFMQPEKSLSNGNICNQVEIPLNYTVNGDNRYYSFNFVMFIETKKEEGRYNLFFHSCPNYNLEEKYLLNFSLDIEESNRDNFLSADEMPLPALYFMMSILFWLSGIFWVYILKKSKHPVFKIHYLMAVLVFLKSLSLMFHAINYHFIETKGEHVEAWAILYYITHLLKGAVLFITIVLIGTGWTFIKHILADRDKKLFMIVIPLQVLANVAEIIIEESEEGDIEHKTWRDIFILVDLLCCGAILFPVVWSIRHLQEASQTDGKAAMNLRKLKLFRQFYLMIVCYIYFTRVIVYLLKITVPFQYGWLDEMFREMATYVFFVITGYKFRPTSAHPYFQVDSDDECEEENEILTETGLTEGLTKVTNRSIQSSTIVVSNEDERENLLSKRESSHEYD